VRTLRRSGDYDIRRLSIIIFRLSLPDVTFTCTWLYALRFIREVFVHPLLRIPSPIRWVSMGSTHISLAVAATTLAPLQRRRRGHASTLGLWLGGSAVV
jgi:hypothetical protein